ncbi:MAG TPA: hypothetical protein VF503_23895 [Sphingobium sp.]|uniref:hypothetical protein n=1 Tax=Sphingobium sp. TaxID=1912891 RepID=UPI002ED230C2
MKEFEYYRKRMSEEDERARRTMGSEAELVHRSLAAQYARRALTALTAAVDKDEQKAALQSA